MKALEILSMNYAELTHYVSYKELDEAIAELEALENKRKEDGKCKHKKTKTKSFCFGGYDETVYTVCKKCGKTLKVKYKE